MTVEIIGQQGPARFLIDAGTVPDGDVNAGLPAARIYDVATGELGDPIAVGSITAHSPGWIDPTAPDAILADIRERVGALLPSAS